MPPKGKAKEKAVQDANDFIESLRLARHVTDGTNLEDDWNAQGFHACLKELSDELYSKPAHFIAEMVQNADDNMYAHNADPALTLAYRGDGHLFVGCNEVGFDERNVKAICNIAGSTKKKTAKSSGYIGEKGIGFKSVFKVADEVWISSGPYSFKFNRDDILGMIVPIKAQFPETKLVKEQTRFCLHIPEISEDELRADPSRTKNELRDTVTKQMLQLSAETLLFLRKLKTINIIIVDENEKTTQRYKLTREEVPTDDSSEVIRLIRTSIKPKQEPEVELVTVFRGTATELPPEEKRRGISESEIVIAFPHPNEKQKVTKKPASTTTKKNANGKRPFSAVDDAAPEEAKDDSGSRNTFNFLPIRNFGFPFLLHADFILTSNREEIIASNRWNDKLKREVSDLFASRVPCFSKTPALRFTWPQFMVPAHDAVGTVMNGFVKSLRNRLCKTNILESQHGDLRAPKDLCMPRELWMDSEKRPLLDDPKHLSQYISPQYPEAIMHGLSIVTQTTSNCMSWLKHMSVENIQAKPSSWHSQLAKALTTDSIDLGKEIEKLKDMKIIPLQDGGWASGKDFQWTFFCDGDMIDVPKGINCSIVADDAAKDPIRRQLFEALGITTIDPSRVCTMILARHTAITSRHMKDPAIIIEHLWYLFKTPNTIEDFRNISVVSESGNITAANTLYMDALHGFKMSEHFDARQDLCEFIHPDVLARAGSDEQTEWHDWLEYKLKVATLPRLASRTGRPDPAFQHLIDNHPSHIWLQIVRDNWRFYFDNLTLPTPDLYGLGEQLVECTNTAERKPLKEVYLKTTVIAALPLPLDQLDFVNVPDPDHPGWKLIGSLGLGVQPDLPMYLSILRSAMAQDPSQLTDIDFPRIFREIQQVVSSDQLLAARLRDALKRDVHIPVAYGGVVSWRTLEDCRWHVPFGIDSVTSLEVQYPNMQRFFTETLGTSNATIKDVMNEIAAKAGDMTKVESLRNLLLALGDLLRSVPVDDEKTIDYLRQVLEKDVFPVKRSLGEVRLASLKGSDWFVADRDRLFKVFREHVWLLDYDDEHLMRLKSLFNHPIASRFVLSQAVAQDTAFLGVPEPAPELTQALRNKAKFFSMLFDVEERTRVLHRMQNSHIYTVQEMTLKRYVMIDGKRFYGHNEVGDAVQDKHSEVLALNIAESSALTRELPWYTIREILCEDLSLEDCKKDILLFILFASDDRQIRNALDCEGLWDEAYSLDTPEEQRKASSGTSRAETTPAQATSQPSPTPNTSSMPGLFIDDDDDAEELEPLDVKPKQPSSSQQPMSAPKPHKSGKAGSGSTRRGGRGDGPPSYDESQEKQAVDRIKESFSVFESTDIQIVGTDEDTEELTASEILQPAFSPKMSSCSQQTRYLAELFAYLALAEHFQAPKASWTSPLASKYTGTEPPDLDAEAATFTIDDLDASQHITNWLINGDHEPAHEWRGKEITYHIHVKPTDGKATEHFQFSAAEMKLARECSESEEHVYILLRVSEVKTGNPKVCACVDPFGMILGGKLKVATEDGFAARMD